MRRAVERLFSLEGRTALVTGASSGIGQAIAHALGQAGASVWLVARREDELRETAARFEAEGIASGWVAADLGERTALRECAAHALEASGGIDIVVNAAGTNPRRAFEEVGDADWDRTLELNLSAPFFLAQALAPGMRERGWGRIINIASLQSLRAFADGAPYGASKGGVMQLTRAIAEAWSRHGVTCNALAPGFFRTALTAPVFADPQKAAANAAQTMIGRNGELTDLYGAAIFLASEASAYITGQTIFVDGGYSAK